MDAALDGESPRGLPAGWQAQLESHMAGCAHCRAQWELLRAAEQALRVPRAAPAPEGMLGDFRRRLAHESPAAHPTRRPWGWLWPTTSLAAAGAVAVLAVTLNLQAPLIPGKTSSSAGPEMAGGPGPSIMTQRAEPSGPRSGFPISGRRWPF